MVAAGVVLSRVKARLSLSKDLDLVESSGLFDVDHYRRQTGGRPRPTRDAIRAYLLADPSAKPSPSLLFDPAWYARRNPDVAARGGDPLVHYIRHGAAERRNPHPLFDTAYYAASIGASAHPVNPLHHFLHVDRNRLRSPHPLFDGALYDDLYPDVAASDAVPFLHFVATGAADLRTPHLLFDPQIYLAHAGPLPPGANPLVAYLEGPADARTHYLFDPAFYLDTNKDVAAAGTNPLIHYATRGDREGRAPSPFFDWTWYVERHPAALRSHRTALEYFLVEGRAGGHDPNQYFDSAAYAATHPEAARDAAPPIRHLLDGGLARALAPSARFDPSFYLADNPEIATSGVAPYEHFMRHGRFEGRRPRSPARSLEEGRFAVLLHLPAVDLLPTFVPFLTPIADRVDLFVTSAAAADARVRRAIAAALPSARIIATEAHGGAAAFLDALTRIDLSRYIAVCKLHGDAMDADDDVRRLAMLQTLLGPCAQIEEIAAAFRFDDDVWLVGPADLYVSTRTFVGAGTRAVMRLMGDLYPHVWPDFDWGFFAGAMFWFRPVAMARLAGAIGAAPRDAATMAAAEHVFALACAVEGKKVGLTRLDGGGAATATLVVRAATAAMSDVVPAVTLARLARMFGPSRASQTRPQPRIDARPAFLSLHETGVNLIGPLGFVSGLGTSARGYQRLLEDAGVPVHPIDWEDGFTRLTRARARSPRTLAPAPVNIVHINLDLLAEGRFLDRGDLADRMGRAQTNILIFYWELPKLLPEWVSLIARFDEVWCPSRFIEAAVRAASGVPTRLLRPELRLARTMRPRADRSRLNLPADRFVFAYVADGGGIVARKNPALLVDAYCAEFGEDEGVCCYLKLHYQGGQDAALDAIRRRAEARTDIVFCRDLFDDATMDVLFQSIDCYVSPHRSEGLGLTILEAMQHGKPVIATPFGGAADFVSESTAYPLAYELAPVGPGAAPYPEDAVWAEPSIASLRRQMRRVFEDRRGAAQRCAAAARHVADLFAGNAASARAVAGPSSIPCDTRVSA